jgi:FkbM family methyltransferase
MRFVDAVSKLELAVMRRLPVQFDAAYVPSLRQRISLPGQISSVFNEIFVRNDYRPVKDLPQQPNIVDLGSNTGLFIIYINQITSFATIYGFEANPNAMEYLCGNIGSILNNNNVIRIFNLVITNYSGYIDFLADQETPANVACTSVLDISDFPDAQNFHRVRVPCARLADVVSAKIDFLKCDIEGAEYGVLDSDILNPDKTEQAVCEFHDIFNRKDRFEEIWRRSIENGYVLYRSDGNAFDGWQDVIDWTARSKSTSMVLKFCARD